MATSSNFGFLTEHDPVFLQLATTAEQVFAADPNTTLIKLRQLGEALAQDIAARAGIEFDADTAQADLLYKLQREIGLDPTIRSLFHTLRIEGNKATHQFRTQHKEAMDGLKIARTLAVWFHQSFGKAGASFKPGPFVTLQDPSAELGKLQTQIDQLRADLAAKNEALGSNQALARLMQQEKQEFTELAQLMEADTAASLALAEEQSAQIDQLKANFEARLQALQAQLEDSQKAAQKVTQSTQGASKQLVLTEELTRLLIDQLLVEAGWEADTQQLTYAKGIRPEKGKHRAIAEWPTAGGQSADYVLFAGLTPIAVVEAKRENVNVAGKIPQAERYARGFQQLAQFAPAWQLAGRSEAWPDSQNACFEVPFVYSCNSRPFLKQLAGDYELSGQVVKVSLQGATLTATVPGQPPYELVPTRDNTFDLKSLSGFHAKFTLKADGSAEKMTFIQPNGVFEALRK